MPKASEEIKHSLNNEEIGSRLDEIAALLEAHNANTYRVKAYRSAASLLRGMAVPVQQLLKTQGLEGLEKLPGIGYSLAHTIQRLAVTGRLGLLERLRGHSEPERMFRTVAGIGPGLAHEIHSVLGIETLQELEMCAHDGRLARVPGMGTKRLRSISESLAGRFRRESSVSKAQPKRSSNEPLVSEILDVDREYRKKARGGSLPLIAPKRFNPTGEAWLPVLHTQRGLRHYTALFSNTARAHELGTMKDWVIIYRDDKGGNGQWTVITGLFGETEGKRIVRGREQECIELYSKTILV